MPLSTKTVLFLYLSAELIAGNTSWNLGLLSSLGQGEQAGQDYNYNENILSSSFQNGPWYLDLKFEYSNPPEFGYQFTGFNKALLRYSSNSLALEFGDITATFGRGLALSLYEDQTIDFDNQVRGLRISSSLLKNHEIDMIVGSNNEYRFYSPASQLREPDGIASYELAGLEVNLNSESGNWNSSPYLITSRLKSDYRWQELDFSTGAVNTDTVVQTMHALQGGLGQSIYGSSWDIYAEYNFTWKAFDYPLVQQGIIQGDDGLTLQNLDSQYESQGQALNIQLNWFPEWFTAAFEYKRYLNGPELLSDKRDPFLLASKPLPWQLGSTGIRQHDISLLGNVTHPVDYGDELGWNLELWSNLNDNWAVTLYFNQTSQARDSRDLNQVSGFIPVLDITQNPWYESFAEIEYSGKNISQRMLVAYTRSVLSGSSAAEITNHLTIVPAYLSWHLNNSIVLSTVVELQQSSVSGETYTGSLIEGHDYQSAHTIGSVDLKNKYSAALIWDTSNDPVLNSGKDEVQHWVSTELSLKPTDRIWIRGSYGKEKGGIRCTGGVCRVLNPFEGYRMTVEWRL